MHDRELRDDEQADEDPEPYRPDPDPISEAVRQHAYVQRYTLAECCERFDGTPVARFPETFDRYYFGEPRVLVDVLADGDDGQLASERARKRCAFKESWCAEHGWTYLALAESDAGSPTRIRELLAGGPAVSREVETAAESLPKTARKRGSVQRPKATA